MLICLHSASLYNQLFGCLCEMLKKQLVPGLIGKVYFEMKGVEPMVSREDIVAEIQKVPEKHLEELYRVVKDFEAKSGEEDGSNQSVMEQLRQIKISASPDFSIKANLYDEGNDAR
jgi:isopentenyl phosphate kinase